MGQCLKFVRGHLLENGRLHSHFWSDFLTLMLDQFSQRRKMRLELTHLIKIIAKLYELFLEVTAL